MSNLPRLRVYELNIYRHEDRKVGRAILKGMMACDAYDAVLRNK